MAGVLASEQVACICRQPGLAAAVAWAAHHIHTSCCTARGSSGAWRAHIGTAGTSVCLDKRAACVRMHVRRSGAGTRWVRWLDVVDESGGAGRISDCEVGTSSYTQQHTYKTQRNTQHTARSFGRCELRAGLRRNQEAASASGKREDGATARECARAGNGCLKHRSERAEVHEAVDRREPDDHLAASLCALRFCVGPSPQRPPLPERTCMCACADAPCVRAPCTWSGTNKLAVELASGSAASLSHAYSCEQS